MECFVMMPFAANFDDVYATIAAAVTSSVSRGTLACSRLDEIKSAGRISHDLFMKIRESTLCIADVTGSNPNVMWEIGYAMALQKPLILITQDVDIVPFDLTDWRTISYDRQSLKKSLESQLVPAVQDTLTKYEARREFEESTTAPSSIQVFASRDSLLREWPYARMIFEGGTELCVLGGTLRDFTTKEHLELLHAGIKGMESSETGPEGNDIRILLVNPASQGAWLRAKEEGRLRDIYANIETSLVRLSKFLDELPEASRRRIEVRKYNQAPTSTMYLSGKTAAYNLYMHGCTSSNSLWLLVRETKATSPAFHKLRQHFESAWSEANYIEFPDNYAIMFDGLPGSGKTTAAKRLSERLPGSRLISSEEIRLRYGLTDIWSDQQRSVLHKLILGSLHEQAGLGHRRLIIDANVCRIKDRASLLGTLGKLAVDAYMLQMTAADDELERRVEKKLKDDPLYANLELAPRQVLDEARLISEESAGTELGVVAANLECDTSTHRVECLTQPRSMAQRFASALVEALAVSEE